MKTILLADDSITIQKVVELTFSDGEYRVLCVSNGAQALRKIAEARPDIALLDVIMPEKNGYEVCEAMKADPATAGIPVLLLTGTFEPFDRQRAEAAGAEGHLTKPFESHALVARVDELIASAANRPAAPLVAAAGGARARSAEVTAAPAYATTAGAAAVHSSETPVAAQAMPFPPPAEIAPPDGPHPAFATPDAAAGGSYLGFSDIAIEDEVVPDRYDSVASPATVRMAREEVPQASTAGDDVPALEGFVPGYDLPDRPTFSPRPAASAGDSGPGPGTSPPAAPAGIRPAAAANAAPADEGSLAPLSDAALERLAEMIVRRMSDRVVREIAWEVIPGVAETVVRQRIREIEGRDR